MSQPVIRGYVVPFLQRSTGRYDPISGWSFDQEFRGLDANQMEMLAWQYARSGCSYDLTLDSGISTLRTTDNRGNITIDTWEIGVSEQSISLLKNPKWAGAITYNDFRVISFAFQQSINNPKTAAEALNAIPGSGGTFTTPDVFTPSPAQRLWDNLNVYGVTDYAADQYVVRHTTNASNRGYYNVADRNVNCIYTQSQFYSEIRNRNYWIFPCPNEIIGALDQIFIDLPAVYGPMAPYYLPGALKGASPRSTAANNRVNIVTEYKIANWLTDSYYYAV